jgi:hypothetical protein
MNHLHLRAHEVHASPNNNKRFIMRYRRDEQDMFQHSRFVLEVVSKRAKVDRLLITDVDEGTNIVLLSARIRSIAPTRGSFIKNYSFCHVVWNVEASFTPKFPNMWLDEFPLT